MQVPEPVIFHDHFIGWNAMMRLLLQATDEGRVDQNEAIELFRTEDGTFLRASHLAYMMFVAYRRFGQQTFVVGPQLGTMLMNTSLQDVPHDFIRFPYQGFYVATPGSPLRIWGGDSGWHSLTGIQVTSSHDNKMFVVYLWGQENENARAVGDDACFWFDGDFAKVNDLEAYVDKVMSDTSRDYSDGLQPFGGEGVDHPTSRGSNIGLPPEGPIHDETKRTLQAVLRIVMNLCIYLQWGGVEREEHPTYAAKRREREEIQKALNRKRNPKKKAAKSLLRKIEQLSDAHVTWLGRTFEETAQRESRGPGDAAPLRVWVRGHWWPRLNNKEARDRHALRWVKPYERNRDAEIAEPARQYKVKEDSSDGSGSAPV